MSRIWVEKEELNRLVRGAIFPTLSVLDIGTGIQPQRFFLPAVYIVVEPFLPYIDRLRRQQGNDPRMVYLHGAWDEILHCFPNGSIETIFAIDVIEHMEKESGRRFLQECNRIASRQIVIFTPLGMYPQSYGEDKTDRWGMQGGDWQSHRSGWNPDDFGEGWDCYCCKEYHYVDEHERPLEEPFGAFWAIRTVDKPSRKNDRLSGLNGIRTKEILFYLLRRFLRKFGN